MRDDLVARLDDRLRARREPFEEIPVIDLGPLLDGTDPAIVADRIRWALSNAGFMYVENHGIDPELVERMFEMARRFFDLPLEQKMALHISRSGVALRGYVELFGENTDPGVTRDLKECFDVGPERDVVEGPFFGPNQWPAALPGFRETTSEYHASMVALSTQLLRGVALSLDLPADHFESRMRDPISVQRLQRYPAQDGVVDERIIGIGAHTDYGNVTVLAQDEVGGLQVMNRDGDWVEAPPIPDTFVINIGDLVQRMTNDVYLANLHRVVNRSGRERYSIPFFIDADFGAEFAPLDSCVSEANPPRYEAVTCGLHKYRRYRASYAHLADHR